MTAVRQPRRQRFAAVVGWRGGNNMAAFGGSGYHGCNAVCLAAHVSLSLRRQRSVGDVTFSVMAMEAR